MPRGPSLKVLEERAKKAVEKRKRARRMRRKLEKQWDNLRDRIENTRAQLETAVEYEKTCKDKMVGTVEAYKEKAGPSDPEIGSETSTSTSSS